MAVKSYDASTVTRRPGIRNTATRSFKLPHLDCFVRAAADKVLAVRCKSDRVNSITVSLYTLQVLDKESSSSVPNTNAFIK